MAIRSVYEAQIKFELDEEQLDKSLARAAEAARNAAKKISDTLGGVSVSGFGIARGKAGEFGGLQDLSLKEAKLFIGEARGIFRELENVSKEGLLKAFEEIETQTGVSTKAIIATFARMNPEIRQLWVAFKEGGIEEVQRLFDAVVGHSIIPDLIDKIVLEFVKLPDLTKPRITELLDQFQRLDRESTGLVSGAVSKEARQVERELEGLLRRVKAESSLASFKVSIPEIKIPDVKQLFSPLVNQAANAGRQVGDTLKTSIANSFGEISKQAGKVSGFFEFLDPRLLKPVLVDLGQALSELPKAFGQVGKQAGQALAEPLLELSRPVADAARKLGADIGLSLSQGMEVLRTGPSDVLREVTSAVTSFGDATREVFGQVIARTVVPASELMVEVIAEVDSKTAGLQQALRILGEGMKSSLQGGGQIATSALNTAGQAISNFGQQVNSLTTKIGVQAQNTFGAFALGMKQNITQGFSLAASSIAQGATNIGSSLNNVLQQSTQFATIFSRNIKQAQIAVATAAVPAQTFQLPDLRQQIAHLEQQMSRFTSKSGEGFKELNRRFTETRGEVIKLQHEVDQGIINPAVLTTAEKGLQAIGVEIEKLRRVEIGRITGEFNQVGKTADLSAKAIGGFGTAMTLASETGGNKLFALRLALFGVRDVAGPLGGIFNRFGRDLDKVGIAEDKLAQASVKVSQTLAKQTTAMKGQVDDLKRLGQLEGVRVEVFSDLDAQVSRVEKSYKDMITTIESGGKPTAQQLSRIRTEAKQLEIEFQQIRKSGPLPANVLNGLKQLEQRIKSNVPATRFLAATMDHLSGAVDKARAKQSGLSKETETIGRRFSLLRRDTKQAETGLNEVRQSAEKTSGAMRTIGGALNTFKATFLGVFGGNILSGLVFRLRDSIEQLPFTLIKLGSDAEESMSKFATVFEGGGVAGEQFGVQFTELAENTFSRISEFAKKVGRSKFDLAGFAATLQDTFVPLGFASEQAAEMSGALTKLTVDMSSFNNISEPETLRAIQSAIVGNHETMRPYGVIITETTLKLEGLRLGLIAGKQEMSEQQKVMARLSLIIAGNAAAIGDAERTAGSWANQQRQFTSVLKDTGTTLGLTIQQTLAPFLKILVQITQQVGPKVLAFFEGLDAKVRPFMATLADAFGSGNWSQVMDLFAGALETGVNNALTFLEGFIPQAFEWGFNFAVEIANGLIDAASSVIMDAVNYIGELISSFLEGSSPPEQGPLSTIDQWAKGLVDTFSSGFDDADFSFMTDVLGSISDALTKANFDSVKQGLVGLVDEINRTGNFSTESFNALTAQLGEGNEELKKTLELNLELEKARKNVLDVESEVAAAEKAGFVPSALRSKLDAAKKEQSQAEKNIKTQEAFLKFQKLGLDDIQKSSASAGKAAANAAKAGTKAVKEAVDKQLEFIQSGFAREKALLDEKLARGAISYEEYLGELIKLEEKYVDASLEEGLTGNLEEHIANLNKLRAELETLKKTAKEAGKGTGLIPEDLLGKILEPIALPKLDEVSTKITAAFKDIGSTIGANFSDAFEVSVKQKLPEAMGRIGSSILEGLKRIFGRLTSGELTAKEGIIGTLLLGGGAAAALKALAPIGVSLLKILSIAKRFTPVGLALFLVFRNWDKISAALTATWEFLTDIWTKFTGKLGGTEATIRTITGILQNLADVARTIGGNIQELISNILKGEPVSFQDFSNVFDFSGLNLEPIKVVGRAMFDALKEAISERFNTEGLIPKMDPAIAANITGILDKIKQAFADFMKEGELGAELARLFKIISDNVPAALALLGAMVPALLAITNTTGAVTPVIGSLTIGISKFIPIVAAAMVVIRHFGEIWPFVSDALAGVVRVISGAVLVIGGFFKLFSDETRTEGIKQIWQGTADIFTGSVDVMLNAGSALAVFFVNMVGDISGTIANLLTAMGFGPEVTQPFLNVQEAMTHISTAFINTVAQVRVTLQQLNFLISYFLGQVNDFIIGWAQKIYDYLVGNSIIPDLINGIVALFASLPGQLIASLAGLGTSIGKIFIDAVSILPGLLAPILEGKLGIVVRGAAAVFGNLKTILSTIFMGNIPTAINSFVSSLGGVLTVVQKLGPALNVITTVIVNWADFIPSLENIKQGLLAIFTGLSSISQGLLNLLTPGKISEGLTNVLTGIISITTGVTDIIIGAGTAVATFFLDQAQGLAGSAAGLLESMGLERLAEPFRNVETFFGFMVEGLSQKRDESIVILNGLSTQFQTILGLMVSFGTSWGNDLVAGFALGLDNLRTLFGGEKLVEIKDAFISGLFQMKDEALQIVAEMVTKFVAEIVSIPQKVKETALGATEGARELGSSVSRGVQDGLGNIGSFISQQTDSITAPVETATTGIIGFFTNMKNQLVGNSVVPDTVTAIVTTFQTMTPLVLAAVAPLATSLETTFNRIGLIWRTNAQGMVTSWGTAIGSIQILSTGAERAGQALAVGLLTGSEKGLKPLIKLFEDQAEVILEPMTFIITSIENLWKTMATNVSTVIIPEMVLLVLTGFTEMSFQLTTIIATMATGVENEMTNLTKVWIEKLNQMNTALTAFANLAKSTLATVTAAVNSLKSALNAAENAAEQLVDVLEELRDFEMDRLVDAVNELAGAIATARDYTETLKNYMIEAKEAAEAYRDALQAANVPPPSGTAPPPFQTGAWKIPQVMTALLHPGEMVLPPDVAESARQMFELASRSGIGSRDFSISQTRPVMANNTVNSGSTVVINANFPGVTNAREMQGIDQYLNELVARGRAFAAIGQ